LARDHHQHQTLDGLAGQLIYCSGAESQTAHGEPTATSLSQVPYKYMPKPAAVTYGPDMLEPAPAAAATTAATASTTSAQPGQLLTSRHATGVTPAVAVTTTATATAYPPNYHWIPHWSTDSPATKNNIQGMSPAQLAVDCCMQTLYASAPPGPTTNTGITNSPEDPSSHSWSSSTDHSWSSCTDHWLRQQLPLENMTARVLQAVRGSANSRQSLGPELRDGWPSETSPYSLTWRKWPPDYIIHDSGYRGMHNGPPRHRSKQREYYYEG
jgi:hypothetical protein